MIRFVSIIIVIWGLIVQPLMAAVMPVKMMMDSPHRSVPVDRLIDMAADVDISAHTEYYQDAVPSLVAAAKMHCHEKSADDSSSEHCDKCGDNCACATSCVVGSGVAAFQTLPVNLVLNSHAQIISAIELRSYALPSRIFHPPKHA
ncbi:hypothetical protein [Dasania marina]|uniref:hypothetical protein n=1 Tax=Dasania marina TaxID=471499 RepID=UPI0030D83C1A|tara:strand:+ start:11663 stop:12100 length:438 start_codon:yes stop_codon:yes gene_type:complete